MGEYARMLESGRGGDSDEQAALRWLRRAVVWWSGKYGQVSSSADLGNLAESAKWIAQVWLNLGDAARVGKEGRKPDISAARHFYADAARIGYPGAFTALGVLAKPPASVLVPKEEEEDKEEDKGDVLEWSKADLLRKAVDLGHTPAYSHLASLFLTVPPPRDALTGAEDAALVREAHAHSFALFRTAMTRGDMGAAVKVAWCLLAGTGTPRNPAAAVSVLQQVVGQLRSWPAVRGPLASAFTMLGECYMMGKGVPVDGAAAERLFLEAVGAGDATAMFKLGVLYRQGASNVAKRPREGADMVLVAANAGVRDAWPVAALLLYRGEDCDKDEDLAMRYIARAFNINAPTEDGSREEQAKKLIEQMLSMEKLEAMNMLSLADDLGDETGEQSEAYTPTFYAQMNDAELASPLERASFLFFHAQRGVLEAKVLLGKMLLEGDGVEKDTAKAKVLIEDAVKAGSPHGKHVLGKMLCFEQDDEQEKKRGVALLAGATGGGRATALVDLARCYELGAGVPASVSQAIVLYKRAVTGGGEAGELGAAELERWRADPVLKAHLDKVQGR